jgi:predicted RNase H-like HicB family nuclease
VRNINGKRSKEKIMEISFTTQVWKEGRMYVSCAKELNVSSCGRTVKEAKKNLVCAVECFLETAEEMGTLEEILEEAGFVKKRKVWKAPDIISVEKTRIAIPG